MFLASATKTPAVLLLPPAVRSGISKIYMVMVLAECASNIMATVYNMTAWKKATRIPLVGPAWQPLEMAGGILIPSLLELTIDRWVHSEYSSFRLRSVSTNNYIRSIDSLVQSEIPIFRRTEHEGVLPNGMGR